MERDTLTFLADLIAKNGGHLDDEARSLVSNTLRNAAVLTPRKRRTAERNAIRGKALQNDIKARAEHLKETTKAKNAKRPAGGWLLAAKLEIVRLHRLKSVAALEKIIVRGKLAEQLLRKQADKSSPKKR